VTTVTTHHTRYVGYREQRLSTKFDHIAGNFQLSSKVYNYNIQHTNFVLYNELLTYNILTTLHTHIRYPQHDNRLVANLRCTAHLCRCFHHCHWSQPYENSSAQIRCKPIQVSIKDNFFILVLSVITLWLGTSSYGKISLCYTTMKSRCSFDFF